MTAHTSIQAEDLHTETDRETRIQITLLRGMVENIRSNRLIVPVFGLAVCAMFSQWVGGHQLAGWYIEILISMAPQVIVL